MVKITPRDRRILIVGGICVLIFLVLQFVVFPLVENRNRLKKSLAAREKGMVEMKELQARYRELNSKANTLFDQLAKRDGNFSLFSFLEQNAAKTKVKKNIAYMKPSEVADEGPFKEILIEMKLQAVTLKQLVKFLKSVESPENTVALKRISIQENKKEKQTLDVVLQVISLARNTSGELE